METLMKLRSLSLIGVLFAFGCVSTHKPVNIPTAQHVSDSRFDRDRTLVVSDISPIVPAFVELPYEYCNLNEMRQAARKGRLESVLNSTRAKRVYIIGGKKCVNPK